VTLADVNSDGKQDIVAVTENRVIWYESPDWKKHVILEDQTERDNVCIAPLDIDQDGKVDFALGAGWTKKGTIQWISRGKNPNKKWDVHMIGQEGWTHRMRFADVLGTGRPQLVVSPLNKTVADGVRLTAFEIPAHPKTDRWKPTVMDATMNRMHNHWHFTPPGQKVARTLTASQEGIHMFFRDKNGNWKKQQYSKGMPGTKPNEMGTGEIKAGKLASGHMFVATIEPLHGTSVVIYTVTRDPAQSVKRTVIDDTLKQGHAVWMADLDGDGADEVVIGHRAAGTGKIKGPGIYVFDSQDESGTEWKKHVIDDGGMAAEDALAADLNGDGRIDIVAGGRATHNLKLYINMGPESK